MTMTPVEAVLTAGAICTALAAIALTARGMWRFIRRVDAFLEDWNGEPARPGRPARPSMPERVTAVETRLSHLEAKNG